MKYKNKIKIVHMLNYIGFRLHIGVDGKLSKCVTKNEKHWSIPVFSTLKNREYRFHVNKGQIHDTK